MKRIKTEIENRRRTRDVWSGWQIQIPADREIPSLDHLIGKGSDDQS